MDFFFGHTEGLQELAIRAERMARSSAPILIEGETGTGKERLAQYLHVMRGQGELVKCLCDAAPSPAIYGGGTRHGASVLDRLPEAGRDTLLLKRVHRLPAAAQERILLLLEEIRGPLPFLISTASESLEPLATAGRFLPELLYRLAAYRLSIPPLRERRGDIPQLFQVLLTEASHQMGVPSTAPDARALEALLSYSWPGNLRELQNVARSYLLAPHSAELEAELERRRLGRFAQPAGGNPTALKEQVKQVSKRAEGEIILRTLERHRWNRRRTAEALRISYRSLMYKMKNCDIRNDNELRPGVAQ
jgi:two-component system response regulator AtoC